MPRRRAADIQDASEPAQGLARRPTPKRDRGWDASNPAFRVRPEDGDRLAALAERLKVSRDALARALVEAALDAVDQEWLDFELDTEMRESKDRKDRYRIYTRRIVRPAWNVGEMPQKEG